MDIKIYGTDTSGHHLVMSILSDVLCKAKIPFEIEEVNDISEFLSKKIESIPAIQLNNDKIYPLKSNGSFNSSLRSAINKILSTQMYGELQKYLIPVDFSELSLKALSYGHRLATDMDAITQVMHVYRPRPQIDERFELLVSSKSETKAKLDHIVELMDKDWGSDIFQSSLVSGIFDIGFPTEKILNRVKDNSIDLIILGTTGTDDLYKKWLGSVSTDVVDQSSIPVLLIPSNAKYSGVNSILIGIDDKPISQSMANTLVGLYTKFKTTFHLVHIGSSDKESVLQRSQALLVEHCDPTHVVTQIIKDGDILSALSTYATSHQIDIISVVHRPTNIFTKLFDGSITKKMAGVITTPLLILK